MSHVSAGGLLISPLAFRHYFSSHVIIEIWLISHVWAAGVLLQNVLHLNFLIYWANMTLFPKKAALWGFNHETVILVSHILNDVWKAVELVSPLAGSGDCGGTEEHLQHELQNVIQGFQLSDSLVSAA